MKNRIIPKHHKQRLLHSSFQIEKYNKGPELCSYETMKRTRGACMLSCPEKCTANRLHVIVLYIAYKVLAYCNAMKKNLFDMNEREDIQHLLFLLITIRLNSNTSSL